MPRVLSGALLLLVACRREIAAPLGANPVHEVLISVAVPGRCLVGGCDPPSADRTNLGLVRVLNAGSSTAYLEACGQQAAIVEQQFLNGAWAFVGPAIACPNTPGPIALAPGDSIQANWFFASGLRRIVLGVAATLNMSDEALDTSAAVAIP
jgi:hypothetical protein